MLDNSYGDDSLEELNATVISMACIQPTDDKVDVESTYDTEALSEVNTLQIPLKSGMLSKGVHEHTNHEKLKTAINTSDDDQIDYSNIFDDPYVKNNGGTDEHDSNAHDQSFDIESLIYNVKKEAKNQQRMNNEWVKQKKAYEDLERELSVKKDTIEKLEKEKDKIQDEYFQLENENARIRHETKLSKMAFKTINLKNSYDWEKTKQGLCPFLKAGLGYQNPECLKKAIATQPNLYDGERLQSTKVIIDSPDSEETLEYAKESRLKMKDKMIQRDYEKLNALYETFVPQKEIPIKQTYFSTPSTSNVTSESSVEMSDLPLKKMPN
ncbi:hypothetical protein Tco_0667867 [Tanacetum coccineum]